MLNERESSDLARNDILNHLEDLLLTMQAAYIEMVHGEGPEAAMEWIVNTLDGPGLIPDPFEPYGTNAQEYFNHHKSCSRLHELAEGR